MIRRGVIRSLDAGATVAVDLTVGTVAITSPAESSVGRFLEAGRGGNILPLAA